MKPHSYTIVIREKDNVLTSLFLKRPHESFLKPLCKVVEDKHYENEFDHEFDYSNFTQVITHVNESFQPEPSQIKV